MIALPAGSAPQVPIGHLERWYVCTVPHCHTIMPASATKVVGPVISDMRQTRMHEEADLRVPGAEERNNCDSEDCGCWHAVEPIDGLPDVLPERPTHKAHRTGQFLYTVTIDPNYGFWIR